MLFISLKDTEMLTLCNLNILANKYKFVLSSKHSTITCAISVKKQFHFA